MALLALEDLERLYAEPAEPAQKTGGPLTLEDLEGLYGPAPPEQFPLEDRLGAIAGVPLVQPPPAPQTFAAPPPPEAHPIQPADLRGAEAASRLGGVEPSALTPPEAEEVPAPEPGVPPLAFLGPIIDAAAKAGAEAGARAAAAISRGAGAVGGVVQRGREAVLPAPTEAERAGNSGQSPSQPDQRATRW